MSSIYRYRTRQHLDLIPTFHKNYYVKQLLHV